VIVGRWVQRHAPNLRDGPNHTLNTRTEAGASVKRNILVNGKWTYRYGAVDCSGTSIDLLP
jgi:transposase-like protein